MEYQHTLAFAQKLDDNDSLKEYRKDFHIPIIEDKETVYFTGNSLGLQPKRAKEFIHQELEDWAKWGVEGHFYAKRKWVDYHEFFNTKIAKIVGAKEDEVVVMGSLTANIHFQMASFYQPTASKYKILCEAKAFPSDQYLLQSQVKFHGFNPKDAIIEITPRKNQHIIEEDDIISLIQQHKDELALVFIGGVNYYTGQVFDMKRITEEAHKYGILVGFDLAHAVGNIKLYLHEWGIDFAAWCTYKYLNSGPGAVAGIFIHEKHASNTELKRFAGWWGHDKERRFLMESEFRPIPTAEGWQLSNAPVMNMAAHLASLEIFDEVGMDAIIDKRNKLISYFDQMMIYVNQHSSNIKYEVITPKENKRRGAQLSILAHGGGKDLFDYLMDNKVIVDWREPNVIRIAPVALYNSFTDIFKLGECLLNYK